MPNEETAQVMLVGDVAEALGKSASSIERLADCGKLPLLGRTPRGVRVFSAIAIEKFAAELR
jgi:hypothetical protein